MTHISADPNEFTLGNRSFPVVSNRHLIGAAVLGVSVVALAWAACLLRIDADVGIDDEPVISVSRSRPAANPYGALWDESFQTARSGIEPGANPYGAIEPALAPAPERPDAGALPRANGPANVPLPPARGKATGTETAEPVPLPPVKPPSLRTATNTAPAKGPSSRVARNTVIPAPASPAPDNRGFFERLFGSSSQPDRTKPANGPVLAYARPDIGSLRAPTGVERPGPSVSAPSNDLYTAIYDIKARTVYLPNGEKLEAHSGLGPRMDDPRHVHVKDYGPTPPNVYNLELRKQIFHGVRALRLIPAGDASMFGRDGILAHSYLLGPNGDSNGCVSIRDYDRFLQAYLRGEIKRIVVVPQQG